MTKKETKKSAEEKEEAVEEENPKVQYVNYQYEMLGQMVELNQNLKKIGLALNNIDATLEGREEGDDEDDEDDDEDDEEDEGEE